MDTVRPILGYVIAIAVILILAGIGFMAAASADLTSAATTMASITIVVGLLVGVATASRAGRGA